MRKKGFWQGSVLAGLMVLIALLPEARAKTTWTLLYDNVNSGNVIFSIDAVDEQHAWALGVEQVGGNSSSVGLATSNGQTFGMLPLPATSGGQFDITVFLLVAFADTQNGWIFGTKFSMGGEEHTLWKSDNGGMSWETAFTPTVGMQMMQALPTGQLFAVGEDVFLRSPDGSSYEEVTVPVPSGHTLDELFMFNADCGFVVASTDPEDGPVTGAVLWTPDGGDTWETRAEGLPYGLGGMSFVSADLGWLAAKGASEGVILKTTDGGRSWSPQSQPDHPPPPMSSDPAPVTECVDVRFFDDMRGVALCLACTANCEPTSEEDPSYFTVLSWTSDGGATWEMDPDYEEKMNAGPFGDLAKASGMFGMEFPTPNDGFMAGQNSLILSYVADAPEADAWPTPECTTNNNTNDNTNDNSNNNNGNGNGNGSSGVDDGTQLSGCGCRQVPSPTNTPFSLLFLGVLAALWAGRRLR